MGVVPGASSMMNYISQSGGMPGSSSEIRQGTHTPLELFLTLKRPPCSTLVAVTLVFLELQFLSSSRDDG